MTPERVQTTWCQVAVTVAAPAAPGVADAMLSLVGGLEERRSDGEVRLVAYLPADADAGAARRLINQRIERLREAGLEVGSAAVAVRRVRSSAWEQALRAALGIVRVPPVVVKPTWAAYAPAPDDMVVELDSAMAFGTGHHATTQGCLAALARHVFAGAVVFDIGAGSGVLAIAAARLGAGRVIAVEADPAAARVAVRHVALNRVGDVVVVLQADGLTCLRGQADIIAANLTAPQVAGLAREAARRLKPGGLLIASGMTKGDQALARGAAQAAGLRLLERDQREEWLTLVWGVGD